MEEEAFNKALLGPVQAALEDFRKATTPEDFVDALVKYGREVVKAATPIITKAATEGMSKLVDEKIQKALSDRKTQLKAIAGTASAVAGQSEQPRKNGGDMESFRAVWNS